MGVVIFLRKRHVRASACSRAAKLVRTEAVTPLSRAKSVSKTADHHSAGMLSRCHHFETAEAAAPTSAAMASRESQSSITALKDGKSLIGQRIGQSVLTRKDNLALDGDLALGHTVRMAESEAEAQFKQEFIERVRQSRISRGMKQWEIAEALSITQDRYKQYETRSLLPHHMIGRFCIICRVDPEWLLTGRGKKVIQPLKLAPSDPEPEANPKVKPKRTRTRRIA